MPGLSPKTLSSPGGGRYSDQTANKRSIDARSSPSTVAPRQRATARTRASPVSLFGLCGCIQYFTQLPTESSSSMCGPRATHRGRPSDLRTASSRVAAQKTINRSSMRLDRSTASWGSSRINCPFKRASGVLVDDRAQLVSGRCNGAFAHEVDRSDHPLVGRPPRSKATQDS